jgi:hypothetical protein
MEHHRVDVATGECVCAGVIVCARSRVIAYTNTRIASQYNIDKRRVQARLDRLLSSERAAAPVGAGGGVGVISAIASVATSGVTSASTAAAVATTTSATESGFTVLSARAVADDDTLDASASLALSVDAMSTAPVPADASTLVDGAAIVHVSPPSEVGVESTLLDVYRVRRYVAGIAGKWYARVCERGCMCACARDAIAQERRAERAEQRRAERH